MDNKKIWIIAYDIANPKRLRKIEKICDDYTVRVQYSIYKLVGRQAVMDNMKKRILKIIDSKEDSVIILPVSESDIEKVEMLGIVKNFNDDSDKGYIIYK